MTRRRVIPAAFIAVVLCEGHVLAAASDETQAPELGRSGTPRVLPPTLMDEDTIEAYTCQGPVRPRRLFFRHTATTSDARLDPATLRPVRGM